MSEVAERTVGAKDAPCAIELAECEEQQEVDRAIEEAIRRRIEEDGRHALYFSDIRCLCSNGVLKVRGHVPTQRLKDALWMLILRGLEGVTKIEDQLNVAGSTGLSSIRPK